MDKARCRQKSKIVPFDNRQRDAMDVLRDLANNDTGRIVFGKHARERMWERDIDALSVYRALSVGEPQGEWKPGRNEDETKLEVAYRAPGSRTIIVVTVVMVKNKKAFVRTVMWKDRG